MIKRTKNGVTFLTFELFERCGVGHCFSTRIGGVSEGCFASANLVYGRGDSDANVSENFRRVCEAAGLNPSAIALTGQVHGVNAAAVRYAEGRRRFGETDGLVTADEGLTLATFYADCVPLLFFDTKRRVAATAHAGWRGTLAGMASVVVRRMTEWFGSEPRDVIAGIGPCVCGDCYEVGNDVAALFAADHGECVSSVGGKNYVDLKGVNRDLMLRAGILAEHVEVAAECTMEDAGLFFSHRRDGDARGGMAMMICL